MKELHDIKSEETVDLYYPTMCEIKQAKQLTEKERWFQITLPDGADLGHEPGQFVEVSLFGIGEAPISISSAPTQKGSFELCVREAGMLTSVLNTYKAGDHVGIRGPFGHGFDLEKFLGKDVVIIAAGLGIVPLRSLINTILDRRKEFGRLIILYGAKSPDELLFNEERQMWEEREDVEYSVTVDRGDENWTGNTGVITTLIPPLKLDLANTVIAVTGPPVVYKFVVMSLKSKQVPDDNIYVSLERRMKCGVGKCGHCQINGYYCCQDGPVFCYSDVKAVEEAL